MRVVPRLPAIYFAFESSSIAWSRRTEAWAHASSWRMERGRGFLKPYPVWDYRMKLICVIWLLRKCHIKQYIDWVTFAYNWSWIVRNSNPSSYNTLERLIIAGDCLRCRTLPWTLLIGKIPGQNRWSAQPPLLARWGIVSWDGFFHIRLFLNT